MNSLRSGLTVAAVVLGTMTAWAGEKTAGISGSAARGTDGYTIAVPTGERWQLKSSTDGMVYENMIDGTLLPYEKNRSNGGFTFYRAGFSAAPAPAFSDRERFLAYVKQAVAEGSDTSGYATVRDNFTEKEQDGLWLVDCSLNRNAWEMVAVDAHDGPVTRIRTRYAFDPHDSGRVIVAWYAWHGVVYDEKRFESEAATFLNSLQKTSS